MDDELRVRAHRRVHDHQPADPRARDHGRRLQDDVRRREWPATAHRSAGDVGLVYLSAEHGNIALEPEAQGLAIGDRVEWILGYSDTTTFLHNHFVGIGRPGRGGHPAARPRQADLGHAPAAGRRAGARPPGGLRHAGVERGKGTVEQLVLDERAALLVPVIVALPPTSTVAFNVVMDGAAGPRGRYDLLSRRWSIVALDNGDQRRDRGPAPGVDRLRAQLPDRILRLLGSRPARIVVLTPDQGARPSATRDGPGRASVGDRWRTLRRDPPVDCRRSSGSGRQRVRTSGLRPAATADSPALVHPRGPCAGSWIGVIGTAQSLALLVGYYAWRRCRGAIPRATCSRSSRWASPSIPPSCTEPRPRADRRDHGLRSADRGGLRPGPVRRTDKDDPAEDGVTFSAVQTSSRTSP